MHHVGQDEIVILLEMDGSNQLPRDLFLHLNDIFRDADKGKVAHVSRHVFEQILTYNYLQVLR